MEAPLQLLAIDIGDTALLDYFPMVVICLIFIPSGTKEGFGIAWGFRPVW